MPGASPVHQLHGDCVLRRPLLSYTRSSRRQRNSISRPGLMVGKGLGGLSLDFGLAGMIGEQRHRVSSWRPRNDERPLPDGLQSSLGTQLEKWTSKASAQSAGGAIQLLKPLPERQRPTGDFSTNQRDVAKNTITFDRFWMTLTDMWQHIFFI